ncbi:FimV-like protein [Rheinheimera pacifica]|uniref:FimV/HubP family polar landmark protein n=1 Tax=Rheinheimera pacifica TaxID=173990 RepID=UPI0028633C19|nr:FimV/HubP family polar landmark protein [Rheinheimera pacifica]MDR6982209.1 FimV-like protein [Rheinheimera pacifica]
MHQLISALVFCTALAQAQPQQLPPVQPADTLWKLATAARPDEQVAMVQVVYALWQANPQAFRANNINVLQRGAVLKVPPRAQMLATPVSQARQWYYQAIADKPLGVVMPAQYINVAAAPVAENRRDAISTASTTDTELPTSAAQLSGAAILQRRAIPAAQPGHNPDVAPNSWQQNLSSDYSLTLQQRYYPQQGEQGQAKAHSSVAVSAEWVWQSDNRAHQIAIEPFLRLDQRDSKRNLADLRQAYWQYAGTGYDIKAGVDIVFWGVTESQHLVDVINQTDLVASVDGETKLGQPMLNWNLYGNGGTFSLYLLPYFRERTLPGPDGRLRPPLPIDSDNPFYESAQAEQNLDFALRWSRQFGALDLGLSYFEGNNRDPQLQLTSAGNLQPVYLQMQQLGLDSQWLSGSWAWKLESIYRKTRQQDFIASTAGFEYTQVGVFGSSWDLGWIAEYQYDSRDRQAPVPGQNDLFIGSRIVANDEAGSEILLGIMQDLHNSNSRSGKLEASMRLSNSLRLRLDAWFFQSQLTSDPLYFMRRDDYLQLSLDFYF